MKQVLKDSAIELARWSGLMPTFRRIFAGRAAILMFHEIQQDCRSELMTGTSVALLEYSLNWLRQEGWEIVSFETCLERLATGPGPGRYAVLTFDDGYQDNVATALPILERHNAPFMVYVPTGALTRTLQSWWLGLREIFRIGDTVTIDAMGMRFHCPEFREKMLGLCKVTEWIHQDYNRVAMLAPTLNRAGISLSALNDAYFLNERELQILARHPLVSIGGHTASHAALSSLDVLSARAEMADNRYYLEQLLQLPVRHFAFPYGNSRACGPREAHLAKEVGFSTAVTTRHGQVSDRKSDHFALPRVGVGGQFDTRARFEARMSGIQSTAHMLRSLWMDQPTF
ncbi:MULTISPECIES: polysaccharide deacetylase family protein [Bradyrhizobium]|jgi:peptidoglycan/xylan/chitin deacetylase (PgdA/CDA1 family)|uniref:polysaccharide deacetylase family protein n=1 Tax=Bradyrhizobium TaxID=374 RepID=UPI000D73FBDB|nr:polysaccharide deacetylase family protein [Bradyrhizobium diazoefficiens]WLA76421.1 polysaccharide deacetylase family protein [Bradyrhizobium diazoefficiens]